MFFRTKSKDTVSKRSLHRRRLHCEPLEDRRMLSITLFVDTDAVPSGDGLSWTTAMDDLQAALVHAAACNADATAANDVEAIWIAEGTYHPSAELEPGDARSASFSLLDGVTLYGGFAGTEATLAERDLSSHTTTLSGDLGVLDDTSDNAYTVVYCGEAITATVDGLSITGGNANGDYVRGHPERRDGGGIYNNNGNLTFANGIVSENVANNSGGGFYNRGTPQISNCTISDNKASQGGGIYNDLWHSTSQITIRDSRITSNTATSVGGGIANYDDFTLIDTTFSNNTAGTDGGGLYNNRLTSGAMTGCTFDGNVAGGNGGGLYSYGMLTIAESTFASNSAVDGGGIYTTHGEMSMIDSTILDNLASSDGGGIYYNLYGQLNLINSMILNNSAWTDGPTITCGGGIYTGGTLHLTNSTIAGNSAFHGGGLYDACSTSSTTLNNTIIAANTGKAEIYVLKPGTTLIGSYNLIGIGASGLVDGVDGNRVGTYNAPLDPRLNAQGYLLPDSLAIDAGSDALAVDADGQPLVTDLLGNARITGSAVDIGAYEVPVSPFVSGDANFDGRVDGSDVTILANHWQTGVGDGQTATWAMGDFNGDGRVDGSDVTILANNWQAGLATTVAARVAEPVAVSKPPARFTPPANAAMLGVATVPVRSTTPKRHLVPQHRVASDAAFAKPTWTENDRAAIARDIEAASSVSLKQKIAAHDEIFATSLDPYGDFEDRP